MWTTLALLGGAAGLGFLNSAMQNKADTKAYRRQVKLLQMQQNWQERMANTAHQREVKDLRAAGLNPILSATGGNGAATPVVSAPGVSTGTKQDHFSADTLVDAAKSGAELGLTYNSAKKAKADADLATAKAKNQEMQNKITKAKLDSLKPALDNASNLSSSDYWKDVGRGIKEWLKPSEKQYYAEPNSATSKRFLKRKSEIEWLKPGDVIFSPSLEMKSNGKRYYYKDMDMKPNSYFNKLNKKGKRK